jgi:2-hydroxy-6-oxonona-2,4-dienedioate hydrolase
MSTKSSFPLHEQALSQPRKAAPGSSSQRHTIGWYLIRAGLAAVLLATTGVAMIYLRYQQDMKAAAARLAAGSKIIQTEYGLLEYGEQGEGIPVLVLHGAGGGYDQGLLFSQQLGSDFRVIAPSRFGYLNTPIPADGSVSAQADAYAALLDNLGLERVSVVAVSAGGPSALQFALRYPERVNTLVMVSAVSTLRPIRDDSTGPSSAMLTDFVYWLTATYTPDTVLSVLGVPADSLAQVSETEYQRMLLTLNTMLPMSQRLPGMDHDAAAQAQPEVEAMPIEQITVPTLVIHATDDSLIPFAQGQYSADHIPDARLITLDYGGHLAFVLDSTTTEIGTFIQEYGG